MIALKESHPVKKVLTLGLQKQEKEWLETIAHEFNLQLEFAQNEMDLVRHARAEFYDLYIICQTDRYPDLPYKVWLLDGMEKQGKFILIYTSQHDDNDHWLTSAPNFTILLRPIHPERLYVTIWSILITRDISPNDFGQIVARLNPKNWFSKIHSALEKSKDRSPGENHMQSLKKLLIHFRDVLEREKDIPIQQSADDKGMLDSGRRRG